MDDSKQWLWIGDGTQRGPFSAPALIDLFQQQISLQTQLATLPVWCEGMEEWAKAIDTPPFREHIIALLSMWYCADPGVPGGRVGPFTTRELAVRFADGDLDGLTMLFGQTEHNGWESSGWTALTELPCLKAAITAISSHDDEDEEENEDEKGCVSGVVSEADMVFVGGSAEQQPDLPESWTEGSDGGGGTSTSGGEKQQRPQKRYTADDGTRFSWQPSSSSDGGGCGGAGGGGEWVEYAGPDEEWEDDGEEGGGEGDDEDSGGTRQTEGGADRRTGKRPREEEGESRVAGEGGAGGVGGEGGAATEDLPGEGTTTKKQPLSNAERKEKRERSKRNKKKKAQAGAWNEKSSKNHSWVYVQGLPSDVTSAELAEHFSKCGVLALDPATQNPWVKVYYHPLETDTDTDTDLGGEEGTVRGGATRVGKGDASVCYANADSVPLALQVLDGGRLRANSEPISVTKAEFNLKGGAYDASLHKKVSVAAKKVAKAAAAQALTWAEDDQEAEEQHAGKGSAASLLKIVVLTGLFTLEEIAGDSGQGQGQEHSKSFEEELTKELAGELEEKCGEPEKITLFSKNPKGVVVVKFGSAFAAGLCVKLMQGRFFAGRVLSCTYWDGVTDYTVEEAEEVAEKRVEQFGDWIDEQELPPELQLQVEE